MRDAGVNVPVIVQTAHGGIDKVVSAMRAGAVDFVVKPVGAERLQVSLRNALSTSVLETEFQRLKRSRAGTLTFRDIITRNARMQDVLRIAEKAAASLIPVLIEGESGVGKELIARAIHGSGERRAKPFVAVNCGAIPENLVESTLFGHEKGAFTGATETHTGKFVEASGGTLFLDEVGELPLAAQVKLLRAIQEGQVDPVGGSKPIKVDVRIISATNRNLIADVKQRPLPRGPVLSPARVPDHGAAAARAARGHSRAGAAFPGAVRRRGRQAHPRRLGRRARRAQRASVAGQRPPARERGVPRRGAGRRRRDRRAGIPAARLAAPRRGARDRAGAARSAAAATRRAPLHPRRGPERRRPRRSRVGGRTRLRYRRRRPRPAAGEIEAEVIRFAIAHYRGQMSEVARRLRIGRSTLYRKLDEIGTRRARDRATGGENVASG